MSHSKLKFKKQTFDDIKDVKNSMNLSEVFAFLGDFKIS